MEDSIIFETDDIRRLWHKDEWYFSVVDIVSILTQSNDPKQYLKKLRMRDESLNNEWGTICTLLKLRTKDGKIREVNCVTTKSAFRLIQSIPSKKAEPLKQWLAQLGQDRIDEIQNPEIGIQRNFDYYKKKGYSDEWIKRRKFSITTRRKLTDEWRYRGIDDNYDFAILTNIIHTGTFDIGVKEHKCFKSISSKDALRDHMSDIELALISLSEATTTQITRDEDSQGLKKLSQDAKEGSEFGKDARVKIEKRLGKNVVTSRNYLNTKKISKK